MKRTHAPSSGETSSQIDIARSDRRGFLEVFGVGAILSMAENAGATGLPGFPAGVTIMADNLAAPEGPIAFDDGSVVLCEILEGRLTRILPDGSRSIVAQTGGGPNGAAMGPGGYCFVANNGGYPSAVVDGRRVMRPSTERTAPNGSIQRVNLKNGEIKTLYEQVGGQRLRGPNDLVFGDDGGFWFSDMGKIAGGSVDLGSLCWARPDGSECRAIDTGLLTPNGVALSPDRRTLYVALTQKRQILAYRITGPGTVATLPNGNPDRRVLVGLPGEFDLDSMAVEESGNIVVGTLGHGSLTVISAAGALVERVSFPGWVTNLAFGGRDRRTVYATMTMDGKLVQLNWPRPGMKLAWR